MTVRNRLVWVTGACSGIGEALSYELSDRGARLMLSSNRPDALRDVRRRCARPDAHHVQPLDLTEPETLDRAADAVWDEAGPVDVLVNNAGIAQRGPAADTDMDVVRRVMEVNFVGAVHLTRAVLPSMIERQQGHVAVVSSVAGKFGVPSLSAYSASKHAVQGWFDSLRAEVHDDGIRVTLACPGFVQTNLASNMVGTKSPGAVQKILKQGITPSHCAEAIADAIEREKAEFYVGGWEVLNVYLKRFLPGLLRRLLRIQA
jgi:short-subunit dehydrogenase